MNAERLAQLVDAHGDALAFYAARWTNAPEDCVQETFVALAAEEAEPPNVAAWLFRVVKNKALNTARGEKRRHAREQAAARLRPVTLLDSQETGFDAASLASALEHLSNDAHELVTLRIWSGLSFDEIAAALNCSTSTAYRKYRTALEQLRNVMEVPSCPHKNQNS